jgi:sugar phosphate isomerase/epimerase
LIQSGGFGLGVQLYSVQAELEMDRRGTLVQLAGMGYRHVEPHKPLDDPTGLRRDCEAAGLRVYATHGRITDPDPDAVLSAAQVLGASIVVVPFLPPDTFKSEADIRVTADAVNAATARARARGLCVGYHNHDHELASVDGTTALEQLSAFVDDDVTLELDVWWATVAGIDVPELIARLGPRIGLLHLKDGELRTGRTGAVGSGDVRTLEILAARHSDTVLIVEIEPKDGPILPKLQESIEFLSRGTAVS